MPYPDKIYLCILDIELEFNKEVSGSKGSFIWRNQMTGMIISTEFYEANRGLIK